MNIALGRLDHPRKTPLLRLPWHRFLILPTRKSVSSFYIPFAAEIHCGIPFLPGPDRTESPPHFSHVPGNFNRPFVHYNYSRHYFSSPGGPRGRHRPPPSHPPPSPPSYMLRRPPTPAHVVLPPGHNWHRRCKQVCSTLVLLSGIQVHPPD